MTGFNLFSGDPQAIWDFMLMNPKTAPEIVAETVELSLEEVRSLN